MRALVLLLAAMTLMGCPKPRTEEAPRDYDSVRQRSAEEHRSLDSQKAPGEK